MATTPAMKAEARSEFGKGPSRRLRVAGRVPGVLYGHGIDPLHFSVDRLEITALVRKDGANAILELELDGEKHLAMVKHIDQNVLTLDIDHVDFLAIKRGEKVEVEVPLILVGEPAAGLEALQTLDVLMVEADVMDIPEHIEISVEGAEDGTVITAADLALPGETTLVTEGDTPVASIAQPQEAPEQDAEDDSAAADAPAEAPAEESAE